MTFTTKPVLPYFYDICLWDRKYLNTPNLSHPIALDGTESFQILIILVLYRAGVLENILLA